MGKEARAAMQVSDSIIIVTNPELPAVADAIKAVKIAKKIGVNVMGIVVNRVANKRHEMGLSEIRLLTERPIIGVIPEDPEVQKSIAVRLPVVNYRPKCRAAVSYKKLAANIMGETYNEKIGLFEYLSQLFR